MNRQKTITIGIDGNEANEENRVGVHMYAYQLLWGLYRLKKQGKTKSNFIVYLKREPREDLPREIDGFTYKVLLGEGLWIIKKLTPLVWGKSRPNVLFAPSHYLPPLAPIPMVCSVMDLGYLESSGQFTKKDYWQLKYWTANSLFFAWSILVISNQTAKDVVRHYPFSEKKLTTTYLGYDKKQFNIDIPQSRIENVRKKYGIKNDYILYLGTLKPSKNIEGLLRAFAKVKERDYRTVLVIAGKKGWLYETIFEEVQKLGLEHDVIFTDYLLEDDKAPLIKGARVFVLPSFWEGFGIDVVSAMACGRPVVISKIGSLPEVGGDVAIYIDPNDIDSIANGIIQVLSMKPKEYDKIIKKGLLQAEKFSWDKTAGQTLHVLEKSAGV